MILDTFASKVSAIQDKYADGSIGNVTGSNAVNVFLGTNQTTLSTILTTLLLLYYSPLPTLVHLYASIVELELSWRQKDTRKKSSFS